jgi:septum formation protein
MRLILASASPRRAELLRAAGYVFDVLPTEIDETVRPGEPAVEYVRRLAREKATACAEGPARTMADAIVIAADTTVVIDGRILGKPVDTADARQMLVQLSGRAHQVVTGLCVRQAGRVLEGVDTTAVEFAQLDREEIEWYVGSGEGRDKAGGYAIQGLASRFIPRIEGSYSNVVGLPIALVHELTTRISVPNFR